MIARVLPSEYIIILVTCSFLNLEFSVWAQFACDAVYCIWRHLSPAWYSLSLHLRGRKVTDLGYRNVELVSPAYFAPICSSLVNLVFFAVHRVEWEARGYSNRGHVGWIPGWPAKQTKAERAKPTSPESFLGTNLWEEVWGSDELGCFFSTLFRGNPINFFAHLQERCVCSGSWASRDCGRIPRRQTLLKWPEASLAKPGLAAVGICSNPLTEEPAQRKSDGINKHPRLYCTKKIFFQQNLYTDSSLTIGWRLLVAARVSPWVEVVHLGERYEFVRYLWSQTTLTDDWMNFDVSWSSNDVLISCQ